MPSGKRLGVKNQETLRGTKRPWFCPSGLGSQIDCAREGSKLLNLLLTMEGKGHGGQGGGEGNNFLVLSFLPPFPPSERRNLFPPLGVQKPLPPAKIWLIPLPVADPTPTYGKGDVTISTHWSVNLLWRLVLTSSLPLPLGGRVGRSEVHHCRKGPTPNCRMAGCTRKKGVAQDKTQPLWLELVKGVYWIYVQTTILTSGLQPTIFVV